MTACRETSFDTAQRLHRLVEFLKFPAEGPFDPGREVTYKGTLKALRDHFRYSDSQGLIMEYQPNQRRRGGVACSVYA